MKTITIFIVLALLLGGCIEIPVGEMPEEQMPEEMHEEIPPEEMPPEDETHEEMPHEEMPWEEGPEGMPHEEMPEGMPPEDEMHEGMPEEHEEGMPGDEDPDDMGMYEGDELEYNVKSGTLTSDEYWSGEIYVDGTVIVPEGVTLTIEPGTKILFKHDRNYKTFNRGSLLIDGGTIKAIGTKEDMIWFTSDAEDPINGDWAGITVKNSNNSEFRYVIIEFGVMGIMQFDSSVPVTDSIVRWINAEGLYAERSSPSFERNLLYENGYHEIALEQFNTGVQIRHNTFHNGGGGWAIHTEKTESNVEGNYFYNYPQLVVTAGMESNMTAIGNRFYDTPGNAIRLNGGSTGVTTPNEYNVMGPIYELDIEDTVDKSLGYIPGSPEDQFPYVYDEEDETRRVVNKVGEDLKFGWALEYADGSLYRFSLGSGQVGQSLDFIKINPETGDYVRYGNDVIMNPRGLIYDGQHFYVNDFSLLKIYKFEIDGNYIKILDSFDIPDKEKGGTMGMTSDGTFLYLRSRDGKKVYQLTKDGTVVEEIYFQNSIAQAIVWTGEHFWTFSGCSKGICKWTKGGELVGEIYPAADGTWAMAWEPFEDGGYLWTIQRTCENWNDPKIYKIEILDDSLE